MSLNQEDFEKVTQKAFDAICSVLPPEDGRLEAYQDYFPPDSVHYPRMLVQGQKKLVEKVCEGLQIHDPFTGGTWDVERVVFEPHRHQIPFHHSEFPSWLVVSPGNKTLKIIYSESKVGELASRDGNEFEGRKLLVKAFLHECGHAALHSNYLVKKKCKQMVPQGDIAEPSSRPEHELEAWLYALVIWGFFVGKHAIFGRSSSRDVDEAGVFA